MTLLIIIRIIYEAYFRFPHFKIFISCILISHFHSFSHSPQPLPIPHQIITIILIFFHNLPLLPFFFLTFSSYLFFFLCIYLYIFTVNQQHTVMKQLQYRLSTCTMLFFMLSTIYKKK